MFFYDGLQATDEGVKRLAGIGFLGPKRIANLCFRQLMRGRQPQHLHQLLLHRGKLYFAAFGIDEPPILQRQATIKSSC